MKKLEREQKAYEFLKNNVSKTFSEDMMVAATGWSPATVGTYLNKKWKHFIEQSGKEYKIVTFEYPNFTDFRKLQTQVFVPATVDTGDSYDYDIALSFAGEDREYVDELAAFLKQFGINIFYDKYLQADLWGKDLYVHLDDVYQNKSKYCVMFASNHYKEKLWTNHERESMQAKAFQQKEEYILPVLLDDTKIPGMRATTGYIDGRKNSPVELGRIILEKLGKDVELDDMIKLLRDYFPSYDITISGNMVEFKSKEKDYFDASYPIGMLLEMHRNDLLYDIMVIGGIIL